MTRQPLALSPSYLAVSRGVRELHRLVLSGLDESPAADAIRDATDSPWEALSEVERRRASGLSDDLYSISDPPDEGPRQLNPQAQARLADAFVARERGQWDRALELLRRWGRYVPPALVSHLRGSIWLDAGDPETAALFYEHAAGLEPENGNYLALYLHTLDLIDPAEAHRRAAAIIGRDEAYPAVAVTYAADIMLKATGTTPEADSVAEYRRLIPILERTSMKIEAGDESGVDPSAYATAIGLLGFCHEFLGDNQTATQCYSRGLQVDPNNDGLLAARGILLYGASHRAITDFEQAIKLDCPLVWPYFLLAHHYLICDRFEECRAMCERAARMPASDSVRSELTEWKAISQAELGFPAEMVRAVFEESLRLDPSNDRARRNFMGFEEAIQSAQPKLWLTPRAAVVRASGLAARRLARAA